MLGQWRDGVRRVSEDADNISTEVWDENVLLRWVEDDVMGVAAILSRGDGSSNV